MDYMGLLMKKDEKAINSLKEDKVGAVRRAIIFEVKDLLRETTGNSDYHLIFVFCWYKGCLIRS